MRIFGSVRSQRTISAVPAAPNRIRIGRKSAVLGLFWQPARPNIPLRDQAAFAGGRHGEFDLFLSYGLGKQHGFASTSEGVASGMLAGATMFESELMSDAWLGVFSLGDPFPQWWVVSVRDGQIYEDRVLPDMAQARTAFEKMLDAPGWERIIAPANWNIPSSEQAELGGLISLRSAIRLRPVNRMPILLLWSGAAAIAAAAGAFGWQEFEHFRDERQLRTIVAESEVPMRKEIPRPWVGAPRIEPFVVACIAGMEKIWMLPAGWVIERAECDRANSDAFARIKFQSVGGGMHFVRGLALERLDREPTFSSNRKSASLTVDVPISDAERWNEENAWSRERVESEIRDRFDALGLGLSLAFRQSKTKARGVAEEFGSHGIALSTSVGIGEYARLLSGIPAIVPESLDFVPGKKVWRLEATAFHMNSAAITKGGK